MRLSVLVVASALLTWSASPGLAQGVMVRRPAASPQTQEARTAPAPESAPAAAPEPKVQEPRAQDPRDDIRKIVREELRAALREVRAAESRAAEQQPESASTTAEAKPAPAPEAVKPAEPAPAARPVRARARQQPPQQDPVAPKPEPTAKKSQDEVIAELEAELRGIQAEIERSMATEKKTEKKPAAKASAEKQQEPAPKPDVREPKAMPVQPSQPAEAKQPPRRMMVLRTEEKSEQPQVIEMTPEEFDRRVERAMRMQMEKVHGVYEDRSELRAKPPQDDDRSGCNCNCECCQQHRGGPVAQPETRAPKPRPQQDRIRWRGAPDQQGSDKVQQQVQRGMPMPPMGPMQMEPQARREMMDRMRARIEDAQRRLRAMEQEERGQDQDRGPGRDGRGRNMEFRRGRNV